MPWHRFTRPDPVTTRDPLRIDPPDPHDEEQPLVSPRPLHTGAPIAGAHVIEPESLVP